MPRLQKISQCINHKFIPIIRENIHGPVTRMRENFSRDETWNWVAPSRPSSRGFCFFYPSTSTGNFADPAGVVIGLTSRRREGSNDKDRRRNKVALPGKGRRARHSERSFGKFSTRTSPPPPCCSVYIIEYERSPLF